VQLAGARRKIDGAAELVFDAGPREFLGLFRHASAMVTNSFHGAAFSLQFQKDFFTSMSPGSGRSPPSPASTACSPGWAVPTASWAWTPPPRWTPP
ncbi:polysaccharide pyruvyl transferase family protein, partial [Flavonifractor plautii]|uniref:polysaccharide pyruvyl transferase family protein n=1 Tax=Flavonifractor plautii TaxID=292800 RepID=UPI00210D47F5